MLDFYTIHDDQAAPNHPMQLGLEFVGGLDHRTFENLQRVGIIDRRFDYYSDFRLGTALIKQIRQAILQRQLQANSDVKMLTQLFDATDKNQSGLIAFGD